MTFYSAADYRSGAAAARTEGLIARMLRLWVEHHQRMLDLGMRPH